MRTLLTLTLFSLFLSDTHAVERELFLSNIPSLSPQFELSCFQSSGFFVKHLLPSGSKRKITLDQEDCTNLRKSLKSQTEMSYKITYECIKSKGCFSNKITDLNQSVTVSVKERTSWGLSQTPSQKSLILFSDDYDSTNPSLILKCASRQSYLYLAWPNQRRILMNKNECEEHLLELWENPNSRSSISYSCENEELCTLDRLVWLKESESR